MNWKSIGKVAKFVAIAVVPGATGYVAYRYVVRPWLDKRSMKDQKAPPQTSGNHNEAAHLPDASGTDSRLLPAPSENDGN